MIRSVLALIVTLTVCILATPPAGKAQSGAKIPTIGILQVGTAAGAEHLSAAFKQEKTAKALGLTIPLSLVALTLLATAGDRRRSA